jgi:hypothetical protein
VTRTSIVLLALAALEEPQRLGATNQQLGQTMNESANKHTDAAAVFERGITPW